MGKGRRWVKKKYSGTYSADGTEQQSEGDRHSLSEIISVNAMEGPGEPS